MDRDVLSKTEVLEVGGNRVREIDLVSRSCPRTARSERTVAWKVGLPRKEVIQPHLPVRLPCYDFVPIAGSALDGSLSCELGHRLQAYPTFMT